MTQRSYAIPLGLICICLALQGCSSVKKTLGIDRDPPNEYVVTPSVQPLEMPPDFSCLPTPMPGVERPQDQAARNAQEEKILGSSREMASSSPGQAAVLDMCGAQANQDHIRHEIDTEAQMEHMKDKPIVEKLGIKKTKPKGDALNPYEEAARLEELKTSQSPSALKRVMPPPAIKHAQQKVQRKALEYHGVALEHDNRPADVAAP